MYLCERDFAFPQRNAVRSLSTTRDGKWLLTADFEQDCVAVVWDTVKGQVSSSRRTVFAKLFPSREKNLTRFV